VIYRQTPRENVAVNSVWMCDYGRLNFEYLTSPERLLEPEILSGDQLQAADWKTVISHTALQLRHFTGWDIAIVASGRMTNEELWLTARLAQQLNVSFIDIVPRKGEGDDILLSQDRNPNTNGAKIILGLEGKTGANLEAIAASVAEGRIKALVVLGEDPTEFGITVEQLKKLPSFITMNILRNAATAHATAILPSAAYAEKRGSMINGRGRLQRLNRAVRPPGQAREDWEILRDILQEFTGSNGLGSIEDVFRQMAESLPPLAGLSLNKIGDLGVKVMATPESSATPSPPGEPSDEEFFERPPLHAVK
jgi:NADH-quinone oxidoreductase subunit G